MQNRSRKETSGYSAPLFIVGGVAAALGAASCCALPMLTGAAWLGALSIFTGPYRVPFLAISVVFLAAGAVLVWRQRASVCAPSSICARPAVRGIMIAGLFAGVVLLYLGYTYA